MVKSGYFADLWRIRGSETLLIIDEEAHAGGILDLFLFQYRPPVIHAFRPTPELASKLRNVYNYMRFDLFYYICPLEI